MYFIQSVVAILPVPTLCSNNHPNRIYEKNIGRADSAICSTTAVVGDRTEYNETEADFEIFGTLRNVSSSSQ